MSLSEASSECCGTCACVLASASEMVEMNAWLGRSASEAIWWRGPNQFTARQYA